MKTAPIGIGIWIAFISSASNGDPDAIVAKCQEHGIKWLAVKSGDSARNRSWNVIAPRLVKLCHDAGIGIYTWNYSYPNSIPGQILQIHSCFGDDVDGHILDAELEWESVVYKSDTGPLAQTFVDALRTHFPDKFLAHAPFAWPKYHSTFPYSQFGQLDAVMDQSYWSEHNNAGALAMCREIDPQWAVLPGQPPRMPIGVSYGAGSPWGHPPGEFHGSDLLAFLDHYKDKSAVSLYSYEAAMPEFWTTLKSLQTPNPPLPPLTISNIQTALNKAGSYGLVVDGLRGLRTNAALLDFQGSHKLTTDGVVGPKTTDALRAYL